MPRVLLLVHGMGRHAANWSVDVTAKLDEVAQRYPRYREQYPDGGIADHLRVVEITYDECFRQYVDQWQESVDRLAEFMEVNEAHAGGELEDFAEVVEWVRHAAPSEKKFFWSHAVDVLLYRFFPLVTDEVRATVLDQFARALTGRNVRGAVLAHSLGTKVTHDCLQLLGTEAFGGGQSFLASRGYFLDAVITVANVSRILGRVRPGDPDVYQSAVHPRSTPATAVAAPGYCGAFLNFRHALDPFTLVKPFRPANWGADYYSPEHDLQHIAADWNVHGLTHFLDHPAVHVPILNMLLAKNEPFVSEAELPAIVSNYAVPSLPPCQQAVQHFKATVDEISARIRSRDADVRTWIIAIAEFYAAVEVAIDECR